MAQSYRNKSKIAIVGAGPAGVYCALNILFEFKKLNFNSFQIVLFEKSKPLKTLLPTGGGRCNITSAIDDIDKFIENYPRGKKFLRSLFSRYFNYDAIDFFSSINVEVYIQEDKRVFPVSNSSIFVRDALLNNLFKFQNVKIVNKKIKTIDELSEFDKIIISCGSREVLEFLKTTNHTIIPFKKALCALTIKDFNYKEGLSVNALDGDFVFTKNGISGPLAFKISSLNAYSNFPYEIKIRLFDYQKLLDLILDNPRKSIGNLVSNFIPKALAKVIVKNYAKKASEVSKDEIINYSILTLEVTGVSDKGEIVYAGGVSLDEVDKNAKSKIKDNLWFCGEVLNIDGFTGGFNLQNCWSSAYVVAKDVISSIIK